MGKRHVALASAFITMALTLVPVARANAVAATYFAHGSVAQVYVLNAKKGDTLELRDAANHVVQHGTVDDLGSLLFRDVAPGDGYTVVDGAQASPPLHVMAENETPPPSLYTSQHLVDGFQYITTRDGTRLSAEVHLPGPAADGPYPTVIEYSGYDPSHPGHPQPSEQIAQLLGYATVGVNIRGTGCSGGAFTFFEPLQSLDGYDVVETVAAQPWVLHGKPGMVGISYPGIAQTFVAATRPPHLAAVAPLSVLADVYDSISYPGGIPNIGFPREWAGDRDQNAQPFGQGWEKDIVSAGGPNGFQCLVNQLLRHQSTSLVDTFDTHPYREPVDQANALSPELLDANVNVPVFMGGAWQDEQTGGQSSLIWQHLTEPPSKLKLFGTNGTHVDSLVAELNRWYEFLEFYVAQRIPHVPPAIRALAPVIFQQATGISGVQLEPDRFTQYTNYADALHAYESEPPIRVLFENGAGDPNNLGAPFGTYEMHFSSWPPENAKPTAWYFGPDQTLSSHAPRIPDADGRASTSYVYDPTAKPATDFHGSTSDIWTAHPDFDWRVLPLGKALAFDSAPLSSTTVMAGPGSVDLWLRSTAADTDLEVTVTELRPDGQELYVQNGWLRASHRALAPGSTALQPLHSNTSTDAAPLPADQFVPARVALYPFAHIFRAGSRLRITVEAPGGNRPFWAFGDLPANGTVVNSIGHSRTHPSRVVLPVIDNPAPGIPAAYPPCGSLRGEPCRPTVGSGAATNAHAFGFGRFALVTWTAPVVRPGTTLAGYVVSDNGHPISLVAPTTNFVVASHLAFGRHSFTVTAYYNGGAHVDATPSNTVRLPF